MLRLLESIGTNESLREREADKEMQSVEVLQCDRYKALQVNHRELNFLFVAAVNIRNQL